VKSIYVFHGPSSRIGLFLLVRAHVSFGIQLMKVCVVSSSQKSALHF